MLLVLIPAIWVAVATLVVAVCRAAARGDSRPPSWHGWHGVS